MDVTDVIVNEIDEKVGNLKEFLAAGSVPSFEEYKRLCGEIRGLLAVREYVKDLKQNLENSDE